jgi:hypothetical protein
MINQIIFNDDDIFDDSKYLFKGDIKLFNYQKKTISTLMNHERGQMKLTVDNSKLNTLESELSNKDYTFSNNFARDMKRFCTTKDKKFLYKNNMSSIDIYSVEANFGYNIGVLSNTVGSGKTLVILGFIMRNKFFKKNALKNCYKKKIYTNSTISSDVCDIIADYLVEKDSFSLNISTNYIRNNNNLFKSSYYDNVELSKQPRHTIKTNLIIVPHNLFEQWKEEINKTYLSVLLIKDKRNLVNIREKILNNDYNIILCNVNKVIQLLIELPNTKYNFERVFIDEADVINLPNFPELNCNFLWLITTTYTRILSPKNNGFINNLFRSNYYSTSTHTQFYKFLLEKLTFSFNKDHIENKLKLSVPNKNFIIVKNNFINSLFYNLEKTTYYKFLNSYDYESLYTYMIRFRGSRMLYFFLRYLFFQVIGNYGNSQDIIEHTIRNTEYNYEGLSSILFLFIIQRLHKINFDIIHRKIGPRIRFIKTIVTDIKRHILNCPQCYLNYGENNIKNFLSFNLYDHDMKDLNDFLNQNRNNNHYKKCPINIDQLKYKLFSLQATFKLLKTEIDIIKYIKHQLINSGYCLKCMTIHNSSQNCNESIFFNLFQIVNIDFSKFDEYLVDISKFYRFKYVREIIYDDIIMRPSIENIISSQSNFKLEQMIISLKKDINAGKRCLVFSDNNFFIHNIIIELKKHGISHRVLKGNTNTINFIIRKYKNKEINVLLLSMKHCGSGINLEMSDNIYIMNFLDKSMETQVIGRVNRIGKKNELNVNYYLTTHEYDFFKQIISSDTKSNIIIEEI